jgi:hypothetical protein
MNTLAYPTATTTTLRKDLQNVLIEMNFSPKITALEHYFQPTMESRFSGILADVVVKRYTALKNQSRHYLLRLNYLAKKEDYQRSFLNTNMEQHLLERANQKLPKQLQGHSDIKRYIQFFLHHVSDPGLFTAQRMAITHCELHLFQKGSQGNGYKVQGGTYLSRCFYPDLWLDGTLLEIKSNQQPTFSVGDLAQLLSYYAVINHRLERNVEKEAFTRNGTTLKLPKVQQLGLFFANHLSTILYPVEEIAAKETWDKFSSLYYYYSLKDHKEAKQQLVNALTSKWLSISLYEVAKEK